MSTNDEIQRNEELLRLHRKNKEAEEAKRIFDLLPQGEGSGLDADMVDGLHAQEIIARSASVGGGGGGATGGGGVTDHGALTGLADDDHPHYYNEARHTKEIHDALAIDAATLEGSDKATVQTHAPAEHGNEVHTPDFLSGTGTITTTLSFAVTGTLTTGTDKAPTIVAPCTLTIVKVKVVVKTAPTGASIIVDVNKAGVTIFTNQANRPEIAIGGTQDDSGTPDVTALAEGDKVTIDIDQIGSDVAGADLTVEVVCNQTVVFS